MQRWKLTIEYKGTQYAGWQVQPEQKTVQGQLNDALSRLFKQDITVQGAGRTDSGVHALGQVAHFDILDHFSYGHNFAEYKMQDALNHFLAQEDIAIIKAEKVPQDFHARFSATFRAYVYRISDRRSPLTFNREFVWHVGGCRLDIARMQEGADYLVGTHDFTTFRAFDAIQQNPLRTLDYITIKRVDDEVHVCVGARSFLHNQVRYITASLQLVGYGLRQPIWIKEILDAKDRRAGGPLAPPTGLFLMDVQYD